MVRKQGWAILVFMWHVSSMTVKMLEQWSEKSGLLTSSLSPTPDQLHQELWTQRSANCFSKSTSPLNSAACCSLRTTAVKKWESPSVCKLWLGSAAGVSGRPGVQSGAGEPMGKNHVTPCWVFCFSSFSLYMTSFDCRAESRRRLVSTEWFFFYQCFFRVSQADLILISRGSSMVESQPWLHFRITWSVLRYQCLGPTQVRLNHNVLGWSWAPAFFTKAPQMTLTCSQAWKPSQSIVNMGTPKISWC